MERHIILWETKKKVEVRKLIQVSRKVIISLVKNKKKNVSNSGWLWLFGKRRICIDFCYDLTDHRLFILIIIGTLKIAFILLSKASPKAFANQPIPFLFVGLRLCSHTTDSGQYVLLIDQSCTSKTPDGGG